MSIWNDILPIEYPWLERPFADDFYNKVVKLLVKDVIRIMDNGIPIDLERVTILEKVVTDIENNANKIFQESPIVKEFLKSRNSYINNMVKEEKEKKKKVVTDFLQVFNRDNIVHRTYVVNTWLEEHGKSEYKLDSWKIKDFKVLEGICGNSYIIDCFRDKSIPIPKNLINSAMYKLAEDKYNIYLKNFSESLDKEINKNNCLTFNIHSTIQIRQFFNWLDISAERKTAKNEDSFDREELSNLLHRLDHLVDEKDLDEITTLVQALIDSSQASIIKNNFIKNFYEYSVYDSKFNSDVLYGNINLFGTKTFRLTSNNPNLLNMPSTGSVYAKSVKKCLIAPKGYILYTVDYSALEDRVIANLSKDDNKCSIFLEGVDGHTLNAYSYFKEDMEKILPKNDGETDKEYVKRVFKEIENGNKQLKALRQKSKSATFGLNYGAHPPKVSKTLNIPIEEAKRIFERYHQVLYKDITKLREGIIVPKAKTDKRVHLGLGCYLNTDNPNRDERTLFNACSQFWSILSLLTINEFHEWLDENNYSNDVKVISSIYDSIYLLIKEDVDLIRKVNSKIISIMTRNFLKNQIVPNTAEGEIGYNWYDTRAISNNADNFEILKAIKEANIAKLQ